jgi:hypothetical protein
VMNVRRIPLDMPNQSLAFRLIRAKEEKMKTRSNHMNRYTALFTLVVLLAIGIPVAHQLGDLRGYKNGSAKADEEWSSHCRPSQPPA